MLHISTVNKSVFAHNSSGWEEEKERYSDRLRESEDGQIDTGDRSHTDQGEGKGGRMGRGVGEKERVGETEEERQHEERD